jgi:hypothetical protein
MKGKSLNFLIGVVLIAVLGFGISGALNIFDFFKSADKDEPPVFRNLLSVPIVNKNEECNLDAKLPENAFWYGGNKCHWECLSGFEKNKRLGICTQLSDERMKELDEIQAALDVQNGVGVEEEADPSILKNGIQLEGGLYFTADLESRCYLSMPSPDKLNGYHIPLKLSCDGELMQNFNMDCIGRQYRADEGILLTGDIQCLNYDMASFFNWCNYEFREDGLNGRIKCRNPFE